MGLLYYVFGMSYIFLKIESAQHYTFEIQNILRVHTRNWQIEAMIMFRHLVHVCANGETCSMVKNVENVLGGAMNETELALKK